MQTEVKITRGGLDLKPDAVPRALTIGNFDGVHVGHRTLIERVVAAARQHGWRPAVLTFDPHPTQLIAPARAPRLLTTLEQRLPMMVELGIEEIITLQFTPKLAQLSAEDFAKELLARALQARLVVIGDNFRFGHRQQGDVRLLQDLGERLGFRTDIVHAVLCRGQVVSSSLIRQLIAEGRIERANRFLEWDYRLTGEVVKGHGIGSRQTVPTLNLRTAAEVVPGRGVYVTRTHDREEARSWPSITNVGQRPTFNGQEETIETFLLAPLDHAPSAIAVEFLHWIRQERKFESPEQLKAQILRDVARAQAYHRRRIHWASESPRSKRLINAKP